jgi:hypothetical protein
MVAGMLYMQVTGGAHVRQTTAAAAGQQTIAMTAAEAKASVRGMQIGLRDCCSPIPTRTCRRRRAISPIASPLR